MGKGSRVGLVALALCVRVLLLAALLSGPAMTTQIRARSGQLTLSPGASALAEPCSPSTDDDSSPERCANPSHDCCLPMGEDADQVTARSAFVPLTRTIDADAPYARREQELPGWRNLMAFSARAPPSFS